MAEQAWQRTNKALAQAREGELIGHAAVRPWAGLEQQPAREMSPINGRDMSQATVRAAAPLVGRDYASSTCPLAPTRCPYGGVCHACPTRVQAKLRISQPRGEYEEEADRIADMVMRMPKPSLQREPACENNGSSGQDIGSYRTATMSPFFAEGNFSKRGTRNGVEQPLHSAVEFPKLTPSLRRIARSSLGELAGAVWGVGPWDAYKAKQLADRALRRAQETGLPGLHNGLADAWRHCYWNCTMTAEIGADQAETVATNHERHGGGPENENRMDFHNNAQGRACGGSNCDQCCQSDLDSGQLRVIDGAGRVIPSTSVARPTTPRVGSGSYYYGDQNPADVADAGPTDADISLPGGVPDQDAGVP
jgi:hypothetical protein